MRTTSSRDRSVQRIILIEGSANLVVLVAKLFVGINTGSLAVLGDAIHSLTDLANNFIAWFVIRISAKPADREHPYGHRKFEVLAVFFLATLLTVLAFELASRALTRDPFEPAMQSWGLALMLGVLTVNIALATWQRYWAIRLESGILLADANHTFADVLTTIVVIVGWQLSARGFVWLDTACALAVAVLVLYLAFSLFKRAVPALVDQMAIAPEVLATFVEAIPGVREVSRVRSRWIGSDRAVDVVVKVARKLPTNDAHQIADRIESALEAEYGVRDISIHIEPSDR
jgi:cation diffusion facilitator family transporter